ncbi:MAG: hypothetical protein LQ352_004185 [Teloschistes flavicans]|nr:MAG: hypothetical protein LQ352_004185 [Teloschistes flavicans]
MYRSVSTCLVLPRSLTPSEGPDGKQTNDAVQERADDGLQTPSLRTRQESAARLPRSDPRVDIASDVEPITPPRYGGKGYRPAPQPYSQSSAGDSTGFDPGKPLKFNDYQPPKRRLLKRTDSAANTIQKVNIGAQQGGIEEAVADFAADLGSSPPSNGPTPPSGPLHPDDTW